MSVERHDPPLAADERAMLESFLDYHRATLAIKCEGLSGDQLREAAVPPSNLTLLGLVRHLSDVERHWFRRRLAGEPTPPLYWSKDEPDGDFENVADADVADAFAVWHAECARSRSILASIDSLDELQRGSNPRDPRTVSVRWVLVHMIEEYARHNGHADFIRERIDGVTGE